MYVHCAHDSEDNFNNLILKGKLKYYISSIPVTDTQHLHYSPIVDFYYWYKYDLFKCDKQYPYNKS